MHAGAAVLTYVDRQRNMTPEELAANNRREERAYAGGVERRAKERAENPNPPPVLMKSSLGELEDERRFQRETNEYHQAKREEKRAAAIADLGIGQPGEESKGESVP